MINFLYSPKSQTSFYIPESVVSFTILPFQISLRPHDLQAKSHFIYYWLQKAEAVPVSYVLADCEKYLKTKAKIEWTKTKSKVGGRFPRSRIFYSQVLPLFWLVPAVLDTYIQH